MPTGKIVLVTFGSRGDLHPHLAIALALKARGHAVTIATSGLHRARVEAEGIGFQAARPDVSPDDRRLIRRLLDPQRGAERLVRELVLPSVREAFDDLLEIVRRADLVVTSELAYGGILATEVTGVRWISSVLAPGSFFSAYDPPVIGRFPLLTRLHTLGPGANRVVRGLLEAATGPWFGPWWRLRAELGLPPGGNPLFGGKHSPRLVLALFSRLLASPQPDWPRQTRVAGFAFYDGGDGSSLPVELERFLEAGPPPVVFTLGSTMVLDPGRFWQESVAAAWRLNRRAVLVGASEDQLGDSLPSGVIALPYASYGQLFPRAAAIVHVGGIGTVGQALRAGRPMLVVPFNFDQPDNAARVARLGAGRALDRSRYRAGRVAAELALLLGDQRYAATAAEIGRRVRSEDGLGAACDIIEEQLSAGAARLARGHAAQSGLQHQGRD